MIRNDSCMGNKQNSLKTHHTVSPTWWRIEKKDGFVLSAVRRTEVSARTTATHLANTRRSFDVDTTLFGRQQRR